MAVINLTAQGTEQTLIKEYLEINASDILADKINNGVTVEKDGKPLISRKDLKGFMTYACDEARKLSEKGARLSCVKDDIVFDWAIHYFEEDSIEGKLYNPDGTEYKPPKPVKTTTTYTPPPKPKPQLSLFDLLDEKQNTAVSFEPDTTPETQEKELQESEQAVTPEPEFTLTGDTFGEELDEPDGLRQISETQYVDSDGVVYDAEAVPDKENDPALYALKRLINNFIER